MVGDIIINQGEPFVVDEEDLEALESITDSLNINFYKYFNSSTGLFNLPYPYIGYLKLPSKSIVVQPKHEGVSILHAIRIYYFINTLSSLNHFNPKDYSIEAGADFNLDVKKLFIDELKKVIKIGLPTHYSKNNIYTDKLHGNVDLLKSHYRIKLNKAKPINTNSTKLSLNHPINALFRHAFNLIKESVDAKDATLINRNLPHLSKELIFDNTREYVINSVNYYCSHAIHLAKLIVENYLKVTDSSRGINESLLFNFDSVFEKFVKKVLLMFLKDNRISYWRSAKTFGSIKPYDKDKQYLPDILYDFKSSKGVDQASAIIDVKNKSSYYFSNNDIYQMQYYSELLKTSKLILIYPSAFDKEEILFEPFTNSLNSIKAMFINIAASDGVSFIKSLEAFATSFQDSLYK